MCVDKPNAKAPRLLKERGLSIVELLVGITIGLFVLAGATMVVSSQLSDNRQLLLETQVQQDLRTAADMITRDLRRSGYWGKAIERVWPAAGTAILDNMYQSVDSSTGAGGRSELNYRYSESLGSSNEDNIVASNETFGFAWNSSAKTIEMKLGAAGWQTVTDPSVMNVTAFGLTLIPQLVTVPCARLCVGGGTACWPRQTVRHVEISITGQAVHSPLVVRSLTNLVRLRNDSATGSCPV